MPSGLLVFTLDESEAGRVTIPAAPGYDPSQYEVNTFKAKMDGVDVPGSFVKIILRGSVPDAFYLSLSEFKPRVAGEKATYEKDWDPKLKGSLACTAWDDYGRVAGSQKSRGFPASLFTRTRDKVKKYDLQVKIWQNVALELPNASRSGRLWKSHDALSPLLELYVVANEQFLTEAQLIECLDDIDMTDLDDWLTVTVLTDDDLDTRTDLRCISSNLLGLYSSYMSTADIKRMVAAQTQGKIVDEDWLRAFPDQTLAEQLHKTMTDAAKKTSNVRFSGRFNKRTSTKLTGKRPPELRVDANKIMGASANASAAKFWPGDTAAGSAAEWLHRSAYSFGPIMGANWQSDSNIVFGTYEANGHMTRVEGVIHGTMRSFVEGFDPSAKGKLTTEIFNKGKYKVLDSDGDPVTITIPTWVSNTDHSYSWLSPELRYYGTIKATHAKLKDINYAFETKFHTLSTYLPLSVEGKLDRRTWVKHFNTKYGKLKRPLDDHFNTRMTARISPSALPSGDSELPPLEPTGPPVYMDVPINQDAWLSAHNKDPVFMLGYTEMRNPRFLKNPTKKRRSTDPDPADPTSPPEGGFVLVGDIDLFGISGLTATLSSWHGPPPPEVEIDGEPPICQQVEIPNLAFVAILPWLAGTPFENPHLADVTFTYQNYEFEPTKSIGLSISANLFIDEQFGSLNQILSNVLQIPLDSLTLQVTASFGFNNSWSSLPSVSSFTLEGLIFVKDPATNEYKTIQLFDGVSLNNIGVRVFGVSTPVIGTLKERETTYGFGIFGELGLQVPASKNPLVFDFGISEFGGVAQLSALLKGDIWENALGLGFDLESVTLSASFDLSSPLSTLDLAVGAHLEADTASVTLSGSYSTLIAPALDIGLDDLALVIASKDEPALSTMNPIKFPIKQGVHMCAVIAKIDQVEQLLRHSSPGLILSAAWSKASGFVLDINFPTEGLINFGKGITTDPIELQINLKPIRLMIDAGLKVPVPNSTTPLDFKMALSVEDEEVYISGQMLGLWMNPFGISPRVSIGPNLALEIGIILPQFVLTGIPSALGFSGSLTIGHTHGNVAIQINEDPTRCYYSPRA